ncbi:MAG: hypothetical protein PHI27_06635 [Eubacteriales bacterium]|nr:hypothetical protein [Eubacteriales bacterium]MDD4513750.1 hypothetical protein [Eubacteriales bacterium]
MEQQISSVVIKKALSERHYRDFFLTECKSGSTWLTAKGDMKILDALAIRKSWTNTCFTGYEIKVSRGDFLRDAKFYTYEELCNCLYVVCPKGMIERTELPESVGLIYYNPETKNLVTKKKAIYRDITYSPDLLLYIIFSRLDSDRIPFYSDKKAYFEDYVAEKEHRRHLGKVVGKKLVAEIDDLQRQLEELRRFRENNERYKAVLDVCMSHNINTWSSSFPANLDKALTKQCPDGLDAIRSRLEDTLNLVKRIEEKHAQDVVQRE